MTGTGEKSYLSPSQLGLGKDVPSNDLGVRDTDVVESIFNTIVLPRRDAIVRAISDLKRSARLEKQSIAGTDKLGFEHRILRQHDFVPNTISPDYTSWARRSTKNVDRENGMFDDPGVTVISKLARIYGYECFDVLQRDSQDGAVIFTHAGPPGIIYHSGHHTEILVVDANPLSSGETGVSTDILSWDILVKTVLSQGPRSVASLLLASEGRPIKAYRWHISDSAELPDS